MILDKIENVHIYAKLGEGIARGLELLESGKLDVLEPGKHLIDGEDLYASVQEYEPKPQAEGRWEAHRKYIDIQYMVKGAEEMGCAMVDGLAGQEKYDEEKDVEFLAGKLEAGTALRVGERMFAIFYPQDAHMPMLMGAGSAKKVKKIVLKVLIK
jgi:YhcH/YjgK/YiaL family protein